MFRSAAGRQAEAARRAVAPPGYGLVAWGQGDIHPFGRNDFTVNRLRILIFAGGEEIIRTKVTIPVRSSNVRMRPGNI